MILKMYFYLEWTEKRPSYITVLTERPKQINYECEVKIDKKDYIICGNINTKFRKYYPPCKLPYSKNQYLLSHLQKSKNCETSNRFRYTIVLKKGSYLNDGRCNNT